MRYEKAKLSMNLGMACQIIGQNQGKTKQKPPEKSGGFFCAQNYLYVPFTYVAFT